MLFPSNNSGFDKRPATSVLVLLFALVGMLVTGANLQARSLAADFKFNKNEPVPVLLASSGSSVALAVEHNDNKPPFDSVLAHRLSDITPHWRFAGLATPTVIRVLPQPGAFHLRPPLRAPPLQ